MFKETFARKKVLIPFIMAGVPSLDQTYKLSCAMIEEGAGVLELGVPFSDPSADGKVLQEAADVALKNRVTLRDVLTLAKRISETHPEVPIVLFTYLNPLLAMGLESYVKLAVESGVKATLTVDLPLEEAGDYRVLHAKHGLKTVFLASPTTVGARLKEIDEASTAFLYYISRNGVTGERASLSTTLKKETDDVRSVISAKMAIGFGISTPEQAKEVSLHADGVIIGSSYMRMIMENTDAEICERKIRAFTRDCATAIE